MQVEVGSVVAYSLKWSHRYVITTNSSANIRIITAKGEGHYIKAFRNKWRALLNKFRFH